MPHDHRGNPVGNPSTSHGGARRLPRLERLIGAKLGVSEHGRSQVGRDVINAHRGTENQLRYDRKDGSYQVYDPTRALETMARTAGSRNDSAMDMHGLASDELRINKAVAGEGGTGEFLDDVVRYRKLYKEWADTDPADYY